MGCCGDSNGPKWKREIIQDQKFDFVDVDEFYDPSCMSKFSYCFIFMVVIKSTLVYMADLWTAVSLLVIGEMAIAPSFPIIYTKWIFLGCILLSFLLLAFDIRKARMIIESRDISYAFTSVVASRYYTLRSYSHYCFFNKIHNSKKATDEIAFFVFFTLKGWKRLLLADAPRAVINALTLWPTVQLLWIEEIEQYHDGPVGTEYCPYGDVRCVDAQLYQFYQKTTKIQMLLLGTMAFSLILFIISAFMVVVASILYIPLLCHIRGNLKEYCCHKIDKRIGELLKRQARKRREKELRNNKAKGNDTSKNMGNQPTLPQLEMYDDYNRPLSATTYSDQYVKTPLMTERGYGSPAPAYSSPVQGYQQSPYMNSAGLPPGGSGYNSPGKQAHAVPPMSDGSYEYNKSQEHMYRDSTFNAIGDYSSNNESPLVHPDYQQYASAPEYEAYYGYAPSPGPQNANVAPARYQQQPGSQEYNANNRF